MNYDSFHLYMQELVDRYTSVFDHQKNAELSVTDAFDTIIKYYEDIIGCMPGNVYWLDKNCIGGGCNKNVLDMFGLSSLDKFRGLTFEEMGVIGNWTKEATAKFKRDTEEVFENGEPNLNREEPPIPHSDGRMIYFLTSRVPLFDREGNVIAVVGISIDITDRKMAEEELKKAKEEAEIANQLKSQFIANMEHDLRTPASGIMGLSEIMAKKETDSEKRESMVLIAKAGKQLLELLNSILEFDHLTEGDRPVLARELNIVELINDVVELEGPTAQLKQIELITEFKDNVPLIVVGDAFRVKRILINLVSNAIKFTGQGFVKIKVNLAKSNNNPLMFNFIVEDTGIGIPEDKQEVIYEKFVRINDANRGLYSGTGFGLYIVKQFVTELGGKISVKSELGKGTVFTCTIPFQLPMTQFDNNSKNQLAKDLLRNKEKQPSKKMAASFKQLQTQKTALKVLLVEDDKIAQMAAKNQLKTLLNCSVDIANAGHKALKLAQQKEFDLIFMDLGLPDMSGIDVIKQLKNLKVNAFIAVLTAHRKKELRSKVEAFEDIAFITKPLNTTKVNNLLQELYPDKHADLYLTD